MFNFQTLGIVAIVVVVIGAGAWWYHSSTQAKIENLQASNAAYVAQQAQLNEAINESDDTITFLQNEQKQIREQFERLQSEFATINLQNAELRAKLDRHDIGALAAAKPELVERIINNASDKAGRCFEILSGSPYTEDELNAKTSNAFNSECPFLAPNQR